MQCFASVRHWAIRLSVIAWAAALGGCFQPTFVSRKVSAISKSFGFSGKVQAGPLQVGEVSVYSLTDSGTRGELLGSSTTDLDGNFNVNISKDFGGRPVMVVASGGVFEEEASAAPVNLGAGELVALVDAAGGTVAVPPLSHLA